MTTDPNPEAQLIPAGAEPRTELVTIPEGRLDQNPVAVYLSSLDSEETTRSRSLGRRCGTSTWPRYAASSPKGVRRRR